MKANAFAPLFGNVARSSAAARYPQQQQQHQQQQQQAEPSPREQARAVCDKQLAAIHDDYLGVVADMVQEMRELEENVRVLARNADTRVEGNRQYAVADSILDAMLCMQDSLNSVRRLLGQEYQDIVRGVTPIPTLQTLEVHVLKMQQLQQQQQNQDHEEQQQQQQHHHHHQLQQQNHSYSSDTYSLSPMMSTAQMYLSSEFYPPAAVAALAAVAAPAPIPPRFSSAARAFPIPSDVMIFPAPAAPAAHAPPSPTVATVAVTAAAPPNPSPPTPTPATQQTTTTLDNDEFPPLPAVVKKSSS